MANLTKLTAKQERVFAFMMMYRSREGIFPTELGIARGLDLTMQTVRGRLEGIVQRGRLRRARWEVL